LTIFHTCLPSGVSRSTSPLTTKPSSVARIEKGSIAPTAFEPCSKSNGIRLHDLRHGWASLALAAGVNPKIVSERLGHATVSFTLDTYSHVMPGLQENAAARVAALLRD
jgi:integrase